MTQILANPIGEGDKFRMGVINGASFVFCLFFLMLMSRGIEKTRAAEQQQTYNKRIGGLVAIVDRLCGSSSENQNATVNEMRSYLFGRGEAVEQDDLDLFYTSFQKHLHNCTFGKYSMYPEDMSIVRIEQNIQIGCDGYNFTFFCSLSNLQSINREIKSRLQGRVNLKQAESQHHYHHRFLMVVLPWMPECKWSGKAKIDCHGLTESPSLCPIWLNVGIDASDVEYQGYYYSTPHHHRDMMSLIFHEVGHTLGLLHSGTWNNEYGDTSCAMGSVSGEFGLKCFNAPQSRLLGVSTVLASINASTLPRKRGQCFSIPAASESPRNQVIMYFGGTEVVFSYRNRTYNDAGLIDRHADAVSVHTMTFSVPYDNSTDQGMARTGTNLVLTLRVGQEHTFRELSNLNIRVAFEGYAEPSFDWMLSKRAIISIEHSGLYKSRN